MNDVINMEHKLETASRQLAYLVNKNGHSYSNSMSKLKECSSELQTAVDVLETIAKPNTPLNLPPKSPLHVLAAMVRACPKPEESMPSMAARFIEQQKNYQQQVTAYILSLKNTAAYCAVLVVLGFVIAIFYHARVLPQFVILFGDAALPAFSLFMYELGMPMIFGVLVVAGIFSLALSWSIKSVIASAQQFTPVTGWLTNIYVVRQIVGVVNAYLYSSYCYMFSELKTLAAMNEAIKSMKLRKGNSLDLENMLSEKHKEDLQLSQELGTLEFELEHQINCAAEKLGSQLVRFRTGINIGFQILIFLIIGAMVIAFYLPIFALGNAF